MDLDSERCLPPAPQVDVNPYTGKWNKSDGQGELRCTGIFGMATIGRLQQVMGTTIDGILDADGSPAIERFQKFLNSVVPADTQIALNGYPALEADGILGSKTWKTFQYLVIAWHKDYLPQGGASRTGLTARLVPPRLGRFSEPPTTPGPAPVVCGDHVILSDGSTLGGWGGSPAPLVSQEKG